MFKRYIHWASSSSKYMHNRKMFVAIFRILAIKMNICLPFRNKFVENGLPNIQIYNFAKKTVLLIFLLTLNATIT